MFWEADYSLRPGTVTRGDRGAFGTREPPMARATVPSAGADAAVCCNVVSHIKVLKSGNIKKHKRKFEN